MVWRKRYSPPGTPPGTLRPPEVPQPVRVTAIHYTAETYTEQEVADVDAFLKDVPRQGVLWLNVDGLGDVALLEKLGQHFGLHPLSLEDVLNVPQRPKLEDYEAYQFLVIRMAMVQDMADLSGRTEQVSLFLGPTYVLTIQEHYGDVFEPVRQRLRQARGRIRRSGPDYLAYALLDAAIDGFFPVLEHLSDRLTALEEAVLARPTRETLEEIYAVRRALNGLRRALWPAREAVSAFARSDSPLVSEQTKFFLRDCYDHVLQVLDVLESYRELSAGLMETYLSSQSHHLNEVMKVLTIIATIFIPLTFIAGIYGMNFNPDRSPWNMPELNWYWGYPFSLLLMAAIAAGLVFYFRRRGWL
ncbi:MAG: magnesium transport protein CorA [Candidatus Tectimicrobiota bacterium]|nr:MAG: magnesium transport protein CorA [Candidatus Tectomicrobia bacterium]